MQLIDAAGRFARLRPGKALLAAAMAAADKAELALAESLIETVNEIASISDYRCAVRRQYCNLARRLKLLIPMFEEVRESKRPVGEGAAGALASLKEALDSAKDLLRFGSEGSKIYMVCTWLSFFALSALMLYRNHCAHAFLLLLLLLGACFP